MLHELLQFLAQPVAAGAPISAQVLISPLLRAPVQIAPPLASACPYDERAGDRLLKRTSTSILFAPCPTELPYAALLPWAASFRLLEPKTVKYAGRVPKVSVLP